ncbi:unnamed protein product, partial [Symbiodinium sp. CCMP2456]
ENLAGTENWENVGELHGLPVFVSYCPVVITLILRSDCPALSGSWWIRFETISRLPSRDPRIPGSADRQGSQDDDCVSGFVQCCEQGTLTCHAEDDKDGPRFLQVCSQSLCLLRLPGHRAFRQRLLGTAVVSMQKAGQSANIGRGLNAMNLELPLHP